MRGELLVAGLFALLVFSAAVAVGHDPATRRRLLTAAAGVLAADMALGRGVDRLALRAAGYGIGTLTAFWFLERVSALVS